MPKAKKATKVKKRIPTEREIQHDRSLKFCPYMKWELVFSEELQELVRFLRYDENDKIRVASVHAIAELPHVLEPLRVHRP